MSPIVDPMSPIEISMLFALLAVLVVVANKLSNRTLFVIFGTGGFLVLSGVFVGYFSFRQQPEVRLIAGHNQTFRSRDSSQKATVVEEKSTEQMWEHLHRSRIVLDSVQQTEEQPATVSKAKEQKTEKANEIVRPDWVDTSPKRIGNVYREVVTSGPYSTPEECHRALERGPFREVVRRRIEQLTGASEYPKLERLGLDIGFVLSDICRKQWIETIESPSVGEMKIVHVQMEFDASANNRLRTAYRNYKRQSRIVEVGGIAALAIGGLAMLYGLLKFDTWTRGYYTKRLFFGVPAVIIVLVLLGL